MGFHEDDRIRRKNAKALEGKEINVYCSTCTTELNSVPAIAALESGSCPNCGEKTLYRSG